MNDDGIRDIYLPSGTWIDFWTGEILEGCRWLKNIQMPLERMPIYVKPGAEVPVYLHPVQCTDEMDLSKAARLVFDDEYQGLRHSILRSVVSL